MQRWKGPFLLWILRRLSFFLGHTPSVYIVGGGKVYDLALKSGYVDEVYLTNIPGKHGCNVFFSWMYLMISTGEPFNAQGCF